MLVRRYHGIVLLCYETIVNNNDLSSYAQSSHAKPLNDFN